MLTVIMNVIMKSMTRMKGTMIVVKIMIMLKMIVMM